MPRIPSGGLKQARHLHSFSAVSSLPPSPVQGGAGAKAPFVRAGRAQLCFQRTEHDDGLASPVPAVTSPFRAACELFCIQSLDRLTFFLSSIRVAGRHITFCFILYYDDAIFFLRGCYEVISNWHHFCGSGPYLRCRCGIPLLCKFIERVIIPRISMHLVGKLLTAHGKCDTSGRFFQRT